jgi:hypothetical protein
VLRAVVVELCPTELAVLYEGVHSKFCFLFALFTFFQSDGGVALKIVPVRALHGEVFRRDLLVLRKGGEFVNRMLLKRLWNRGEETRENMFWETHYIWWEGATLKSRSRTS